MHGGAGADTYIVDNYHDTVSEYALDAGIDTVLSSATYQLGGAVERLELTGDTDIDGFGNDDDNDIVGNTGNNRLNGRGGADMLAGESEHAFWQNRRNMDQQSMRIAA